MREPAGGTGGGIAKVLARYHDEGGRDAGDVVESKENASKKEYLGDV